jgi:hypothetical protein
MSERSTAELTLPNDGGFAFDPKSVFDLSVYIFA